MSIEYTYKIIAVDEAARCMEVVYSAEGHKTMHIGARLPFESESLEDVIKAFAPVAIWQESVLPVAVPTVGFSGTVTPDEIFNAEEPTPVPETAFVVDEVIV